MGSQPEGAPAVTWLPAPAQHDFDRARSYLSLLLSAKDLDALIARLETAQSTTFKAKDIVRASRLAVLPETNPGVGKELARIRSGEALSPVLLVRGRIDEGRPAEIADGYHRVCAAVHVDENTEVPARIVGI